MTKKLTYNPDKRNAFIGMVYAINLNNMKRIHIYITIFTLLISMNAMGQSQEREGEDRTDTKITLLETIDNSQTVILFENEMFIVKTSLSNFKENIDNWLIKYPHLKSDKKLLKIVMKNAKKNSVVNASIIADNNKLLPRLQYRIADLLENGQCLVLNKKDNAIISEIKVQTYNYHCGALCGGGGRRFFVNDILLLQVMDWNS